MLREFINGGNRDHSNEIKQKINRRKNPQNIVLHFDKREFVIQCSAFISDVLFLFTDFDEGKDNNTLENQIIEPEEIEDDEKRDRYLAKYQGVIFSVANLSLQTLSEVVKDSVYHKIFSKETSLKTNFIKLSSINSRNLFSVRHSSFEIN